MASTTFKQLVNGIRVRKEFIENEIESRNFEECRAATEIMCATWFIRGQIEKMSNNLTDIYCNNDTNLTLREYEALDKYINKLSDYYWYIIYDKSININYMLLERR